MKASKLFAIALVAGLGFTVDQSFAQGNEQPAAETPAPTEEITPAEGSETEPYNETVTIDDGTGSGTGVASTESSESVSSERKERLRVYSGKHDGNNVIADPR
jgi:hypothetical protein